MQIKEKLSNLKLDPLLTGPSPEAKQHPDTIFLNTTEPWAWKSGVDYVPQPVINAVKEAVEGKLIHCFDSTGLPELKEAIANKANAFNGIEVDPMDEVLITAGSGHALHLVAEAFLNPGDEIITTDPTFSFSIWGANLSKATVKYIPTDPKRDWQVTPEEIQARVTPRTKLLWFTDPDNPTGRVFTRETIEGIAQTALNNDLILVVDQAFERITYDGVKHHSIAALHGMKERTVTIFTMSKEYGLSSFRIGYAIAHRDVIERMRILQVQNGTSGPSPIYQHAAKVALETYSDSLWEEWVNFWQEGRNIAARMVNNIPGISATIPKGGYYIFADISKFGRSMEVCNYIAERAHVVTSPGIWFGPEIGDKGLRIVFGRVQHKDLILGLKRIKEALAEHPVIKFL